MSVDMIARGMAAAAAKSGGGSQLPPSAAADKDKFLRVGASGDPAWETVNVVEKFVVTGTISVDTEDNATFTNANHTFDEIKAAYDAGMEIELQSVKEGFETAFLPLTAAYSDAFVWYQMSDDRGISVFVTHEDSGDTWEAYVFVFGKDYIVSEIRQLPESSGADDGKFLRVVNGAPTWEAVSDTTIKLKSSTAGSTKYFNITVNDDGQITATEAT